MAAQDPVDRTALHIAEQAAFLKSILESSTEYSIIAKDWTYVPRPCCQPSVEVDDSRVCEGLEN